MRWYVGLRILGVLLILVGLFLSHDWYDALPKQTEAPSPPIKGIVLLQISFVLEGLLLIWFSLTRWTFTSLREGERLSWTTAPEEGKVGRRTSLWLLAIITLLALVLRLVNLNSDLWLDEITPILDYGHLTALQVVGTYLSSNNHLLNTLLVNLAVTLFGETEWAIRLPAVIFGTATIPILYWVARQVVSRPASLGAALLLAVSYHHIFFSQNARGYTAYLFFSLLASGLLVKGLQEDQVRIWVLYVMTMFLAIASLILGGFVFAAHVLVGTAALLIVMRRGYSPLPLLRRLVGVFSITALLGFQLYATILPHVYVINQVVYSRQASGYTALSREFLQEIARGLSGGLGQAFILGALPFGLIAGVGFIVLFRRQWALIGALALPGLLNAIFLLARGLTFSPRFFLLALPLTILAAIQGVYSFARLLSRIFGKNPDVFSPRLATVLILGVSIILLFPLRNYYSIPKQSYRASIEYLEAERRSDEIVMVIHVAESGYRYYGQRYNLKEDEEYFFIRSVEALEAVQSSHGEKRSFLVTTFPRALHLRYPDLEARIAKGWTVVRTFPATIGDGQISVWALRQP